MSRKPPGVLEPTSVPVFSARARTAIANAFRVLLCDKHLYQSEAIDAGFIDAASKQIAKDTNDHAFGNMLRVTPAHFVYSGRYILDLPWITSYESTRREIPKSLPPDKAGHLSFELPTIHTTCPKCKEKWPFNPMSCSQETGAEPTDQWFFASYQCQSCKSDPVRFLIRRSGDKLTLSGRDPIESFLAPKVLPKNVANYFGSAHIERNSGQILAGLFLLRVFIEQYWRGLPATQSALKNNPRTSGDDLGAIYNATLPNDFKARFPSLSEIYASLSTCVHTAEADDLVFVASSEKLLEHFEAKRLYKIS